MKVNSITRLVLGSILVIFSRPALLNSGVSLSDERVDRPHTAREKHPGKLVVSDPFTNTPDLTRQRSVPVLRIRGRTPARRIPPGPDYLPKFTRLPDVSVICSSSSFVLRVKKIFYGFSAAAEELTLGETCKSNGVVEPHKDLLFTYALTDCQGEQQVFPDYVVYKYVLHYVPLLHQNPFIHRRVNVGVECRYKRNHHVHRLTMSPTWQTPLRKVIRSRSGDFQIQLMDDSWSSPVRSAVYLLGQNVNVQISTRHHYSGVKLFINSCYVATVNTLSQDTKYSIIDNYGCLRESRINSGASRFRFSRADNVVQFSFGAFQFTEAPDAQVSLHCELSVSGGGPSPTQKSCFYRHPDKRWISVFGQDSVCDCCDSVCNQTKTKRKIHEGFVSSDQVLFSDTSPLSTLPSSTLNSTLMTSRNDDAIWFEAKLAKEPQWSYTHKDFVASVTLISSEEDHAKIPHESRTSTVELLEEEREENEEEKHGEVEILMDISKSFVGSERPDLDSMEQFEVESLSWSGERKMQDMNKGLSYWPKKVPRVEVSMKTSVMMVNETMKQQSTTNESAVGDGQRHEVLLPSFISEETDKVDENSSENKQEGLDFLLIPSFEDTSEFQVGSDELVEQGLVTKLDLKQDSDDYYD
ncbi:uncharacterized protein si:ch211-67f13.7 [Rhinichthys klamathensis goyatoka]|uniref:uncharacterized protein si:ch211-67f13.7 n=1 Tax=Rhinichthys klamathensis goyatoka TaxID=3034132 RepID=UPI0024B559D9|nr:uncharacterized protein si:ch211-67f13.7 [Rhinichthys klamathensis goyatoka]